MLPIRGKGGWGTRWVGKVEVSSLNCIFFIVPVFQCVSVIKIVVFKLAKVCTRYFVFWPDFEIGQDSFRQAQAGKVPSYFPITRSNVLWYTCGTRYQVLWYIYTVNTSSFKSIFNLHLFTPGTSINIEYI